MHGYLVFYHKKEVLTIERMLQFVDHIGCGKTLKNLMSETHKRFFLTSGILSVADKDAFTPVATEEGLE